MEAIYHWVGLLLVWAAAACTLTFVLWYAWRARPKTKLERYIVNAGAWVWVFVLGKRWLVPLEGARLLLSAYRQKGRLASWERDIIAVNLRYSHAKGWKQP